MDELIVFVISLMIILVFFTALFSGPDIDEILTNDRYEIIETIENFKGNHYLRYYDKQKDIYDEIWINYNNYMKIRNSL